MKHILALSTALFIASCSAANADQAAERGLSLYTDLCADCHGVNLRGGSAPSLADDNFEYGASDANILENISKGIDEVGMPAFGETLSDSQKTDLLAYIRKGSELTRTTKAVDDVPSNTEAVKVEDFITDLKSPWGIAQIPGRDDWLVTEKSGQLLRINGNQRQEIANIPTVNNSGQGGLLDVAFDPDYLTNKWVYLSYSHPLEDDSDLAMTKIIRGKIEGGALTKQETLFEARHEDYIKGGRHFGSRVTFDDEGHLYFSIGDRGQKDTAQDITTPNGKIHRIKRDGTIPADNPFVGHANAYETIYSYGNRNPQGLIIHPETGALWSTEHGPKGGDELNLITSGTNYGWPAISYGRNYNGTVLTPYTSKEGMAQPISQWTPSIAVCGLDVYTGDLFPQWKGQLLAGALKYEQLRLIDVSSGDYQSETIILNKEGRVRDVTTGHDGAIYVALQDKIVRLSPK